MGEARGGAVGALAARLLAEASGTPAPLPHFSLSAGTLSWPHAGLLTPHPAPSPGLLCCQLESQARGPPSGSHRPAALGISWAARKPQPRSNNSCVSAPQRGTPGQGGALTVVSAGGRRSALGRAGARPGQQEPQASVRLRRLVQSEEPEFQRLKAGKFLVYLTSSLEGSECGGERQRQRSNNLSKC